MTAGRVFRTLPPVVAAKLTRQTSPRFIEAIADKRFAPFVRFGLAGFVGRHLRIRSGQAFWQNQRPGQIFEEFPDVTLADEGVQAVIHPVVDRNGQFSGHGRFYVWLYVESATDRALVSNGYCMENFPPEQREASCYFSPPLS